MFAISVVCATCANAVGASGAVFGRYLAHTVVAYSSPMRPAIDGSETETETPDRPHGCALHTPRGTVNRVY